MEKTFLWGQIISISDKLATLKDKNNKNVSISLSGFSVKNLDYVIATGYLSKNEIFEADYVYVIPQSGIIKPKKTATPSARPLTPERSDGGQATIKPTKTASPSATPKPSTKPTSR